MGLFRHRAAVCSICKAQGRPTALETHTGRSGASWQACPDCDYSISWPQYRKSVCFHIPGCDITLNPKGAE